MRVATVNGLVTLFYDRSRVLRNDELKREWFVEYSRRRGDIKNWESWDLSIECKRYMRERMSWQQVIVVEGVTKIPMYTFQHCLNIKRVIFANTVVRIERFAFLGCKSLVYVKLSIDLEHIGKGAFGNCNLSSVFLPPRCRQVGDKAFGSNWNLSFVHVPRDVELASGVFKVTKWISNSPFTNKVGYYDDADEEAVQEWIKNINNDEKYALHRACCSFEPSKQDISTIIEEKGIGAFNIENAAGITPSQYLKENPYADIDEMDIIRDYTLKMMGEI